MNTEIVNIGHFDMEFVRRALSKNVTVSSGVVYSPIPGDPDRLSVGTCKRNGSWYDIRINLIVPDDDLLLLTTTILNPETLVNPDNVVIDQNQYYLRFDNMLFNIGSSSDTDMLLQIPVACTERSFNAKQKRDHDRKHS